MNGNLPESLMIIFGLALGGGLWPLVRRTNKNLSNVGILSAFNLRAQGANLRLHLLALSGAARGSHLLPMIIKRRKWRVGL
jgi:hypothetical protein